MEARRIELEILQGAADPKRRAVSASRLPIVLQRDRSERDRKRGRGQHRASDRNSLKVGTDKIEIVLSEAESRSRGEVGGVENHERTAVGHVGIGTTVENVVVVIFLRQIASTVQQHVWPVPGCSDSEQNITLDLPLENILVEVLQKLVLAEEAQVGRGEASA